MSYILLFLFFESTILISSEMSSEIDRVIEHLQNSAKELSIIQFSEPPNAVSYINSELIKNIPHQINLSKDLTKFISEWTPDVFASDPLCPYYFSKYNNISSDDDNDLNLLSYLQAIESNKTLTYPFINILPQPYRTALPLLSIFQCNELISSKSIQFFHNIELMIGPGKTELSLKQQSNQFLQLYCSLYGSPNILLINQTINAYNTQTLLSQNNLTDINYLLTNLTPGTCLFIPTNWILGIQLNNSISLIFTLKKFHIESFSCTKIDELTFETIQFTINDTFNISNINLLIYFYQYLNPPLFDQEYTCELFLNSFRQDKNITQLIMKWTPELINLIKIKLFNQLDINNDKLFNINDYINIKQSNINQLEYFMINILEEIRQTVLEQYNQLNYIMKKLIQPNGIYQLYENEKENLEIMLENLPDTIKNKFQENNINIQDVLNKIKNIKSKQSSIKQQKITTDL